MGEDAQSVLPGAAMHDVPGLWMGEPLTILGLDLGEGVFFQPTTAAWADGRCVGGIVWHTLESGVICGGAITFEHGPNENEREQARPMWNVVSLDPLTLTPSVLDQQCGLHGFIADGRWLPA